MFTLLCYFGQLFSLSCQILCLFINTNLCNIYFILNVYLLLLIAGDIELNPGPLNSENAISILHSNIRSIRNKIDFIQENFLDFEILCFTETHLDNSVSLDSLFLSLSYDEPYRKDRTNHGGGILVYISTDIIHRRIPDLEIFCAESIWVELKINKEIFVLGVFTAPKHLI